MSLIEMDTDDDLVMDKSSNMTHPGLLDEETHLSHLGPHVQMLSDYFLCNLTNYTRFPICNNWSLRENGDEGMQPFEYYQLVAIVVPVIFGIVFFVGLVGNTLVVLVIILNKQMRSTTNYLLFSLAVADLFFIVFCVPFTAFDYILESWPFGVTWCKIVQYITYMTASASVYTLLLLSIDRFVAVVYPVNALTIRTERNALIVIFVTWFVIIVACVPLYLVHGIQTMELDGELYPFCTFNAEEHDESHFRIVFITTSYFIPLLVSIVLYFMILERLWRGVNPGCSRSAEHVRSKKKVTRMVVIVVVTFIVCWFPIQIILLLKSLNAYNMDTMGVFAQIAGQVLAYTNSCLNPILYAFFSEPFRKAFHKVISCRSPNSYFNGRVASQRTRETNARSSAQMAPQVVALVSIGEEPLKNPHAEGISLTPLTSKKNASNGTANTTF